VGESDGSCVVGDDVRDFVFSHSLLVDFAELELGFFLVDLVSLVSSLHIVQNPEELSGFLNGQHIHYSKRIVRISSDFVVDFDEAFLVLDDLIDVHGAEGVPESVLEQDEQRNAFSQLVGASRRSGCVLPSEFAQHPVMRRCQSLHVFLWSSSLKKNVSQCNQILTIFSAIRYIY
jgi:hypothetical protein